MTLPIFKSQNSEFMMMQTIWANQLNRVVDLPLVKGVALKNVQLLAAFNPNVINHKLGRKLQGWVLTRKRASSIVYDTQDTNQEDHLTLFLRCSADVSVDLFVF